MGIKKEKSYMLAIAKREEDIFELEQILKRLETSEKFNVVSHHMEDNNIHLKIDYLGKQYEAEFYPTNFNLPELYRVQHFFQDVDIKLLEKSEVGVAVDMYFSEDYLDSYHLQLKIIDTILPEKAAVFDDSAEMILSGQWVAMAASSEIPPAPRYIYTAQAVTENDIVWLHTHGLNRCGLPELEILNSHKDFYQNHYTVLEMMANRMMELEEPLEEKEPLYMGRLSEDVDLVATLVDWKEAVEMYDDEMLGGKNSRSEGHKDGTSAVFAYTSYENYQEGKYEPISVYDELLKANPLYMITNSETARMKALAAERIEFVKKAAKEGNTILLKIGLDMDEEYRDDDNDNTKEHIWFELNEISEDGFTAELTQEPYYVKSMSTGSVGTYQLEDITDWIIFMPERRITPDDVYLLTLDEAE